MNYTDTYMLSTLNIRNSYKTYFSGQTPSKTSSAGPVI